METILCLTHTEGDGKLPRSCLEAVATATKLQSTLGGAPLELGILGGDVTEAASMLSGVPARVLRVVSGPPFAASRYATDAAAVEALLRASGATLVLAPHTPRFARVIAGVAQRFQGRVDTHVMGFSVLGGSLHVDRYYYRQRIEARLSRAQRPWLVTLESGITAPWTAAPGELRPEHVELAEIPTRTEVKGVSCPAPDAQTIRPEAHLLFVAGAGWTKPQADKRPHADEAEKLILEFLRRTNASLGGSKSLVDLTGGEAVLRFMTHMNQIGQTGSTPRHPKGLSTCCHGEEPHTVGWRFISERRAINKDAGCGWARGKADVLYVADAFEVIARVNALLAEERQEKP